MNEGFREAGPRRIESDTGFPVEFLGIVGIRYQEDGKSVFVDSEVMSTPRTILIYSNSAKRWEAPSESDPFSGSDRERIVDNIRRALLATGYTPQII